MQNARAKHELSSCALVVVAAGGGSRFGGLKQLAQLGGKPLLVRTLEAFVECRFAARVVVVSRAMLDGGEWIRLVGEHPMLQEWAAVAGGAERALSVRAGVDHVAESGAAFSAVHDGARPFPPVAAMVECLNLLGKDQDLAAAIVASEVTDTIKRVAPPDNEIAGTENREELRRAETPQVVRTALLRSALARTESAGARDEAECLERIGLRTACVVHHGFNIKITRPADLRLAEAWLGTNAEVNE